MKIKRRLDSEWSATMDERTAVFIISVAARLVAMHPSTLRKYESCGLLEPCRPTGRLRLYSVEDVARLHQIKALVEDRGINLAGVKLALDLSEKARRLRQLAIDRDSGELSDQIRDIADEMLGLLAAATPRERQQGPLEDDRPDQQPGVTTASSGASSA